MKAPGEKDHAIVLHSRAYGEADAVVSLFTRLHGRLSAFVKGARSNKSKGASPMMPTFELSLELKRRPGSDLFVVSAVDIKDAHTALSRDLVRLATANVMLEDCLLLFEEGDVQPEVYDLLAASLAQLEDAQSEKTVPEKTAPEKTAPETMSWLDVLLRFERALIVALGYRNKVQGADCVATLKRHGEFFQQLRGFAFKARGFLYDVTG